MAWKKSVVRPHQQMRLSRERSLPVVPSIVMYQYGAPVYLQITQSLISLWFVRLGCTSLRNIYPFFPSPAIGVCMRRTYENLCVFPKISVHTVYEEIVEFNTSLGRFLHLKNLQKTDKGPHSPHELLVRVLCWDPWSVFTNLLQVLRWLIFHWFSTLFT